MGACLCEHHLLCRETDDANVKPVGCLKTHASRFNLACWQTGGLVDALHQMHVGNTYIICCLQTFLYLRYVSDKIRMQALSFCPYSTASVSEVAACFKRAICVPYFLCRHPA